MVAEGTLLDNYAKTPISILKKNLFIFVIWQERNNIIFSHKFDLQGNKLGAPYTYYTTNEDDKVLEEIKCVAFNRGFSILWREGAPQGGYDVKAIVCNSAGGIVRSAYPVLRFRQLINFDMRAAGWNDGFLLSWAQQEFAGGLTNAYLQRFNTIASRIGDMLSILPYQSGPVEVKEVISLDDGFFIITANEDIIGKKYKILTIPDVANLNARFLQPAGTVYTDKDLPIKALVSDLNLAAYNLTLTGNNDNITLLRAESAIPAEGDIHLLDINGLTASQPYTVTLEAFDKAGNYAADSFSVTRLDSLDFITAFSLDREYSALSNPPQVEFDLLNAANIKLQILDPQLILRKETDLSSRSAGRSTHRLDISGLADGRFYLKILADTGATIYESSLLFSVDNHPPEVQLGSLPAYFNLQAPTTLTVPVMVSKANPALVSLVVEENDSTVVVTELLNSTSPADLEEVLFNPHTLSEVCF